MECLKREFANVIQRHVCGIKTDNQIDSTAVILKQI